MNKSIATTGVLFLVRDLEYQKRDSLAIWVKQVNGKPADNIHLVHAETF